MVASCIQNYLWHILRHIHYFEGYFTMSHILWITNCDAVKSYHILYHIRLYKLYASLYNMKEPFLKQFKIFSHFGSFLHRSSLCSSSQYFGNVKVLFRIPTCEIRLWVKWTAFAVLCNMHSNSLDKVKPSHSGFI